MWFLEIQSKFAYDDHVTIGVCDNSFTGIYWLDWLSNLSSVYAISGIETILSCTL